ncbi:sigma-54-dependent Fis family transcriptional regulator, partial [bacterium]|nr:sigma-54-dependent Fis family transcriptional regulator [bacterium]MBU1025409.1 sigma-54-dependent Fis family transcriptional regulator [bacterium]
MAENLLELIMQVKKRMEFICTLRNNLSKLEVKQLESFINEQNKLIDSILNSGKVSTGSTEDKTSLLIQSVRSVAKGKNIKEILQGTLSGAALLVGAHSGAIVFKEEFESSSLPSIKYPSDSKPDFLYSRTVVEKVMESGKGVYEKDISRNEDFLHSGSIISGRITSVIAAPLKSFGETLGVVYLDSRDSGMEFKEDDLSFLCDFAILASMTYESMSLSTRRIQYLEKDARATYSRMVGSSRALKHVEDLIIRYAPLKQSVLITGETGTGKKLVADELHHRSNAPGPFIVVNCAGIPENLFESEFFGHVKGAYTDAVKDRQGLIEIAQGGTLFLDEIGELSMGTQAKLLLFLDDGVYRRLGCNDNRKSNARMVAATNRILPELIRDGQFREDLYYRLNVLSIELPPLRMRSEDIPELCKYFIDRESHNFNKPFMSIHQDVVNKLKSLPWKGNIRELRNLIQRLVIHTDGMVIGLESLDNILEPSETNDDPF